MTTTLRAGRSYPDDVFKSTAMSEFHPSTQLPTVLATQGTGSLAYRESASKATATLLGAGPSKAKATATFASGSKQSKSHCNLC
eukprot:gene1453-32828_t